MTHTLVTGVFVLGWFAALERFNRTPADVAVWAVTLVVWIGSRRLLRALPHRRTVIP